MFYRTTRPGDAAQLHILEWDHHGRNLQAQFDDLPLHYSFTYLDDGGQPYAVAGGWLESPGVVEVFIMSDQRIRHLAKRALGTTQECLRLLEKFGVWRFQSKVPAAAAPSARFVRALGFEYEGRMRNYYPTGDAHLYSRIKVCSVC